MICSLLYVVAWYKGNLKGKSCFIQGDDYISTSGEALGLYDEVRTRIVFVLSSSNRGRLLGIIDLMKQKNKRMKQEGAKLSIWNSTRWKVKMKNSRKLP